MENSDKKKFESIGERIKRIRKEIGLSQLDFAKSIGIKQATLSDIERGKIGLSTSLTQRISEVYHVSTDSILTGKSSLYFPKDGSLINVLKAREIFGNKNIVNSDIIQSDECFNIDDKLNSLIRKKLRTIEFTLIPLSYRISDLITTMHKEKDLLANEERYLRQLYEGEYKKKRPFYLNMPTDDKIGIISEMDNSIESILDITLRLVELLENEDLSSDQK